MGYSKNKINRAGQLWADQLLAAVEESHQIGEQKDELEEAVAVIDWWRREHARPLSQVGSNLRRYAANEGSPVVTQRLKKLPTLLGKLFREPGMKLARMEDIGGVRAVLPDQDAAYRVASRLRKNWTITRFRDYVTSPKADGYRALHLINRHRGWLIEIQLRTPSQDAWANAVETFSRTIAPGLKFGEGPPAVREYFQAAGEFFALGDQGLLVDAALRDRVNDLQESVDTLLDRAADEPRRD